MMRLSDCLEWCFDFGGKNDVIHKWLTNDPQNGSILKILMMAEKTNEQTNKHTSVITESLSQLKI